MLKKTAYALITSGLVLTSLSVSATPESNGPFPTDNSADYSINIAMSENDSPFPIDNSNDALPDQPVVLVMDDESPFPIDNSRDALPGQPKILA